MVAGQREALASIYDSRCALVEHEVLRALGHRADLAPDAAQDAWCRVARRPVECASAARLDAWLRRVAASAAIDLLRSELARRARQNRAARTKPEAAAFIQDAAQLDAARQLLARLEDADRAILELRARTNSTLEQLASALGIGPAAADSRVRRALDRARKLSQENSP